MDAVTIVHPGAALIMAAVLLWAGLEKCRNLALTAATVKEIGFSSTASFPVALLVAIAEIGIALALLFRPNSTVTHASVVLLAGLFALVGLIALSSGKQIRCHCFGAGGNGQLGKSQILALMGWLAGIALLRIGARASDRSSASEVNPYGRRHHRAPGGGIDHGCGLALGWAGEMP